MSLHDLDALVGRLIAFNPGVTIKDYLLITGSEWKKDVPAPVLKIGGVIADKKRAPFKRPTGTLF